MGVAVDETTAPLTMESALPAPHRSWVRWVDAAALAVFLVIVVAVFWFIHHFAVNMIYYDQWSDIGVINHAHDGTLSFSVLWGQHNENRILFPNLLVLALAYTTHFNIVVEDFLSGIFLVTTTGLLIVAHKRRSPSLPWILYCPVALVFLSFSPLGTTLFGFLVSWYLVMLGLAVALFLLDRTNLTWWTMAGAIVAAVIGSYSSLQGLFIWPAGLVLLYLRRREGRALLVWIAFALPTTVLYFVHFSFAATGGNESSVIRHPWSALQFFFESLGNVTGSPTGAVPGAVNSNDLILGIAVFAIAVVALVHGFRRGREGGGAIGVALICYGLVFVVFTTLGRSQLGLLQESRFATFDLLVWVGAYLALLEPLPAGFTEWLKRPAGPRSRVIGGRQMVPIMAIGALACLFAVQIALGWTNGITNAKGWLYEENEVADITANINTAPNGVIGVLGNYPASFLRQYAGFARSQHLSLFATSLARTDARNGLFPQLQTQMVWPKDGATLSGTALLSATSDSDKNLTKVEFRATGVGLDDSLLATARPSLYGWYAVWNTRTVTNGAYHLRSVLAYADGKTIAGRAIIVIVDNSPNRPKAG